MNDANALDARAFAKKCLTNASKEIAFYGAGAENPYADISSIVVKDEDTLESEARAYGYNFVGKQINEELYEELDQGVQKVVDRINGLLTRYAPEEKRWLASDYADVKNFWEEYEQDLEWPSWLARKIVELDDPEFVEDRLDKLKDALLYLSTLDNHDPV